MSTFFFFNQQVSIRTLPTQLVPGPELLAVLSLTLPLPEVMECRWKKTRLLGDFAALPRLPCHSPLPAPGLLPVLDQAADDTSTVAADLTRHAHCIFYFSIRYEHWV